MSFTGNESLPKHDIRIFVCAEEMKEYFNPTALRKAKIACNFCLSGCNRLNDSIAEAYQQTMCHVQEPLFHLRLCGITLCFFVIFSMEIVSAQ